MRSDGVLPAPETPDLASTMTSDAGGEEAGGRERRERQQRRRGVAAGIRHQPRARDGAALQLGQAVDEAGGDAVRLRIPAGARGLAAQTERAGEIDDADAGVDQRRRQLGRRRVGQREEHDVGFARSASA